MQWQSDSFQYDGIRHNKQETHVERWIPRHKHTAVIKKGFSPILKTCCALRLTSAIRHSSTKHLQEEHSTSIFFFYYPYRTHIFPPIQVLTGHHFPEQVSVNEHPSRVLSPTETESANMGPLWRLTSNLAAVDLDNVFALWYTEGMIKSCAGALLEAHICQRIKHPFIRLCLGFHRTGRHLSLTYF